MRTSALTVLLALSACTKGEETVFTDPSPLMGVDEAESFALPGLKRGVAVIYTAGGVPHVYANDREDLALAMGFAIARDRWFQMDLVRRLSQGTLSNLIGDVVLQNDLESRGIAMTYATDLLAENLSPEQERVFGAYAAGYNAYRDQVAAGALPPPSELELVAPLLGVSDPAELMAPWTVRDVASIGGTILYRLGFETEDIGHTADWERLQDHYAGAELEDLRQPMAFELWGDVTPVYDFPSAAAFGTNGSVPVRAAPPGRPARVERAMLHRAAARGDRIQDRFGRDHVDGWGSNAWAVAGSKTADGRALLAGDGHLELDIPALMYQIGLDTEHFGGGEVTQKGLVLVGMPILSVGTNGHVAWSTTQHSGDITDWYAEEVQLGADGTPQATRFGGEWKPVVRIDETYEIAEVAALGSAGGTVVVPRWTTFDGRWLFDIEGRPASGLDEAVGGGEAVVSMAGDWVVPGDADGDGIVTGITFDFTGLDKGNLFAQFDAFGTAEDVSDFHEATRMGQALSQNMMAADVNGDVYYSGYEMVPCRTYLPRQGSGWIDGADPTMLLDGTTYGGFTIPVDDEFRAIEGDPDPYRCVVPHADYPKSFTPDVGYLVTANQDPGGLESDGDRFNDTWHIGGPWDDGYRAEAINRLLAEAVTDGATLEEMSAIQGHHESAVGRRHSGDFLGAIEHARAVSAPAPGSSDERIAAIYTANQARFDEVYDRLSDWAAAGHPADSGVQTFYHPTLGPNEADNAVATMIFNVWLGDAQRRIFDDEGLPGDVWQGGGSAGKLRVLHRILRDRGPGTDGSAGWNPATEESVLFDDLGTPGAIETSDEMLLVALEQALDFLESTPTDFHEGGFGTDDMSAWTWGLRHQVEFGSLIGAYLDDDPMLGAVFSQFEINADRLDPGGSAPGTLTWFPRPGDNRAIDAANPGLSGRSFRHGSGPVMRMVFALGDGDIDGVNVIPGGQSGLISSDFYDDQAALWLANDTLPVPITVDEVVEQALWRTSLVPAK